MIIKQLIGQLVNLTYRDVMGRIQGTLKECDEFFVCIDPGDDKPTVFVTLTAILHSYCTGPKKLTDQHRNLQIG